MPVPKDEGFHRVYFFFFYGPKMMLNLSQTSGVSESFYRCGVFKWVPLLQPRDFLALVDIKYACLLVPIFLHARGINGLQ